MKNQQPPTRRQFSDPACFEITDADRELFDSKIGDFVPPDAFDAHAHWYDLRHLLDVAAEASPVARPDVGYDVMLASMTRWMGSRVIKSGLYFPFPLRGLDCLAANQFLARQLKEHAECRGLMMIRPQGPIPDFILSLEWRIVSYLGDPPTDALGRRSVGRGLAAVKHR